MHKLPLSNTPSFRHPSRGPSRLHCSMYIPWRLIFGLLPSAAPPSFVSKSRDTTLVIPGSRPPFALPITAQLAGLSIEMDRWPDWVGPAVGKPNLFFNQLLQNLADRTGEGIIIRVGGKITTPKPSNG